MKAYLVAEDRLAGTWHAVYQMSIRGKKPPLQDSIELRNTSWQPL